MSSSNDGVEESERLRLWHKLAFAFGNVIDSNQLT
jgi:hypothetical protein